MKGLELAKKYYLECGKEVLEKDFSDIFEYLAIGLMGSGSECYGFDDELSKDHDFEPGFCIFLPEQDIVDEKRAFDLERAYNKLPKEFLGYKRNIISPAGLKRHGVFRASQYFLDRIGSKDGKLSIQNWLTIPDYILSELTNGEIFKDEHGLLLNIRNNLMNMPEDILFKKLAGNLFIMHQAGIYNYPRLIERKELGASKLALNEYINASMRVIFLLNRTYMPYYKWSFKALRLLPGLSILAEILDYLLNSENSLENYTNKIEMIDNINTLIIEELKRQEISLLDSKDLDKIAYHINERIKDIDIRNLDILISIQ